jgi:type III secretion protein C
MNKFKISRCRPLFKVLLIIIACRTGQPFFQLEASSYENYPSSSDLGSTWDSPDPTQNEGQNQYAQPDSSHPLETQQDGQWTGYSASEEQNQYAQPSQPHSFDGNSSYPLENQQDGQWSGYSASEEQNQYAQPSQPYSFDGNSSYPLENQQDSQWSGYSGNEEQNQYTQPPQPYSFDGNSSYPLENQQDSQWSGYSGNEEQNQYAQPPQPYSFDENSSYPLENQQDDQWTGYSAGEESGSNVPLTFDLPFSPSASTENPEMTDNESFDSYPSTNTDSKDHEESSDQTSDNGAEEDSDDHEKENQKDELLKTEPKKIPNLSHGKSNIKIVKKVQQDESKEIAENVIGKRIIPDSSIGAIDDFEWVKESSSKMPASVASKLDSLAELAVQEPIDHSSKEKHDSLHDVKGVPPTQDSQASSTIAQIDSLSSNRPPLSPTARPTFPEPPIETNSDDEAPQLKEISINFNNVAIIEYIRFISRISNRNFIFDDEDLQFNVTIVSEEPTTVDNLMAALLQELKIRDLSLIEQGNNIIIHRNSRVRSPARIMADGTALETTEESELVTRVFRLNTLDPIKASEIIRPLLSDDALVEVLRDTNNLIITDLVTNVNKIAQLIGTLDSPNSGVTIGQFVVHNGFVDSLVDLATKILQPIAQGNPFVLVPHSVSNSIFIVSNSFIVEKALAILQNLDLNEGRTKIFSLEGLRPSYPTPEEERARGAGGREGAQGRPGEAPGGTGRPAGGRAADQESLESERYGPGGYGAGGYGPGGYGPGGYGAGGYGAGGYRPGEPGREGFGPGGRYANPEEFPENFPVGGIGSEGRIPLPYPERGEYPFTPGGIGSEGRPSAIFDESRDFMPGGIGAPTRWTRELPVGHIERTLFFIHRLRYRKGDQIEVALRKIANSLQMTGTANADLVSAINSSQWIEASNSLIFTGTPIALDKVRDLVLEIDLPLRQVFIEMLILNTTITDSLSYSVDWINRFGGGTTTGEQGFLEVAPGTGNASVNNFLGGATDAGQGGGGVETILSGGVQTVPPGFAAPLPVATGFLNSAGFAAGVIGTHLTHHGTRFSSIGALVRALHTDSKADILLNPKIITEDNNTAEIFVGSTDRYKTQSITNDLGTLITNNFQFIDVGTTLRVTPLIGNNGIITLEIIQEFTAASPLANATVASVQNDVNLVTVLNKERTVTKIHVPNGFFVILSGMIMENDTRMYSQIPCLGGIPIIGVWGKTQMTTDNKNNLMIFIRPLIIDTDDELEDVTKRQQDVYQEKNKFRRAWNYEIDEGLNFLNIKPTDRDEVGCNQR